MQDEAPKKGKLGWLKTIAVLVLGLLALVLAKGIGSVVGRSTVNRFASGYNDGANGTALTAGIQKAVEQIRSQAPIHVDEITTLRDAMAAGKEIVYIMELNTDLSVSEVAAVQRQLQEQNAKNVCSNESTRKLVAIGGRMTWQYRVKSGDVFRVSVDKCA